MLARVLPDHPGHHDRERLPDQYQGDLGGDTSGQQWIIDGYTLTFASLLLFAWNLSDRIGAKRALGSGTARFLMSSIAFDGEQHRRPVPFRGLSAEEAIELFQVTQVRDAAKYRWAENLALVADEAA